MKKTKTWLIVYIIAMATFVLFNRPTNYIHSSGEAVIMGDSIFTIGVWISTVWGCVKIWVYDKAKENDKDSEK